MLKFSMFQRAQMGFELSTKFKPSSLGLSTSVRKVSHWKRHVFHSNGGAPEKSDRTQ